MPYPFHFENAKPRINALLASLVMAILLCACTVKPPVTVPTPSPSETLPGGDGSVSVQPFASFMLPAANMPASQRPAFHAGKALAHQPWIKAPTATRSRDGLGPIYNARTCLSCHINGGRGVLPPDGNTPLFAALVKLSVPGEHLTEGSVPEPSYGDQLQGQSIALSHQLRHAVTGKDPATDAEAPPEAYAYIDWRTKTFTYPDGEIRQLRYPELRLERLGYGPMQATTMTSLRAAPALQGLGLLESIAQQDIDALADPHDRNGDGISGRVNTVWDYDVQRKAPGRFGWKANRANLRITAAAAFNGDVGITTPLFPHQPCTDRQPRCQRTPTGADQNGVELSDDMLNMVVNFARNLGVPKRRDKPEAFASGRALFYTTGCHRCHQPSFTTASIAGELRHLGEQTIWPYTDLLLHDMGPALADNRPDYDASGSEWRTPPLWGIGVSERVNGIPYLLHDGRARNVEEAILWHGGEAQAVRDDFTQLEITQRQALIDFVNSL